MQVFYAAQPTNDYQFAGIEVDRPEVFDVERNEIDGTNQARSTTLVRAESITLKLISKPNPDRPLVELRYTLADDSDAVVVETTWTNDTGRDLSIAPADVLRAERTFDKAPDGETRLFWVEDPWFGQAYGVMLDRQAEATFDDRPRPSSTADGRRRRTGWRPCSIPRISWRFA